MIAAHPESDRCRRVVHEYPADVCLSGKEIIGELAALRIEPRHAIGPHRAGPYVPVLIRHHVVRRAPRSRQSPLLNRLGLWVEHADAIGAVFREPKPVLRVEPAPPGSGTGGHR